MQQHLPGAWSMNDKYDSILVFNKWVHWEYSINPPLNSYGEDDTMSLYIHFYPFQTDSDRINHQNILNRLAKEKDDLNTHRTDSIYRGKKGFYDWMGKFNKIT